MKHIATILILLGLFLSGQTQCFFHKVYDDDLRNDSGVIVIEDSEGNFISAGTTVAAGYSSALVLKTNSCGDTLWVRDFLLSPTGITMIHNIIQSSDTTYNVCGYLLNPTEGATDGFLMSLSLDGDSIWSNIINVGFNDRFRDHQLTDDGGFIIGGMRNVTEDSTIFMLRTDDLGNELWREYYGTSDYERINNIHSTHDGGYVLMGDIVSTASGSQDLLLMKTDSLGNELWVKYYDSQVGIHEGGGYGTPTLDKGFILTAGKEQFSGGLEEAWIVKVDSLGNIEWDKEYNLPFDQYGFRDVVQMQDSSYLVIGSTWVQTGAITGPQAWLLKLDVQGDTIWTKQYSYYGGIYHTYAEDIKLTKDGGAILSGYIINSSLPQINDLWLLKIDSMGNACSIVDTTLGCETLDCNYITADFSLTDTLNITNDSITVQLQGSELATTWNWSLGNGNSILQNPIAVYSDSGTYSIELAVAFDTLCYDTVAHSVVVVWDTLSCDTILANFNLNDTIWVADSNTITLQGPDNADSWNWDFGSLGTSTDQNPTITFTAGSYIVSLVVEVDTLCWDSVAQSIVVIDTVTGLASLESQVSGFKLFPNPNTGTFTIEFSYGASDNASFHMYDMLGRTVKVVPLMGKGKAVTISEENLYNGLYIYELRIDGEIKVSDKVNVHR